MPQQSDVDPFTKRRGDPDESSSPASRDCQGPATPQVQESTNLLRHPGMAAIIADRRHCGLGAFDLPSAARERQSCPSAARLTLGRRPHMSTDCVATWRVRARRAMSKRASRKLVVAAFSYALNLTVGPDFLDGGLRNMARVEHHFRQGTPLIGRWHSTGAGYIYVNETGTAGRSSRTAPDDIDPATVIPPPSINLAVPGRARLCAILEVLAAEQIPPSFAGAVEAGMTAARSAIEASGAGQMDDVWDVGAGGSSQTPRRGVADPSGRLPTALSGERYAKAQVRWLMRTALFTLI